VDCAIEPSTFCSGWIAIEFFFIHRCKVKRSERSHEIIPKRRTKIRSFFFGSDREKKRFFSEATLFSASSNSYRDTVGSGGPGASFRAQCVTLFTD
jgi:hypothetical protein